MSPEAMARHDAAVAQGKDHYTDPHSGLLVMTSLYLTRRGYCCGNICRHCPYDRGDTTDGAVD